MKPQRLETFLERLSSEGRAGDAAVADLLHRMQQVDERKRFSPLDEIHPGWIIDKLEGESPRLFGLLCRLLPGDKIGYLIDHLSPEEKSRMPKMQETYRISPQIVDVVRELIEKKWDGTRPPLEGGSFTFEHIAWMKTDDLRKLFWDLGLDEIRKAFHSVEPKILKAFLSRFTPKDATVIRERIDGGGVVSAEARKKAQKHVVSLSLESLSSELLFREIGFSVFAKALSEEDFEWADLICQKLVPEEGHRLKRIIQQTQEPEGTTERKQEILNRISVLGQKGSIRRYWREGKENATI